MAHRDEVEALRARIEALETENAELVEQLTETTALLEEATATIEKLEPDRTNAARLGQRASEAERARRAAEERTAALQARLDRMARGSSTTAPDPFGARTPETRLASAEQFAREGRSREALQIVLSVHRTADDAHSRTLLRTKVRCDKCAAHVPPPVEDEASARFLRGRCPTCGTLLGLSA